MKQLKTLIPPRYRDLKLRMMDINCLGYFGLIALLLIFFHQTVNNRLFFIVLHIGIIVAISEIIRAYDKKPQHKALTFIRIFYPLVLVLFAWSEIDYLVRMFYGSYWTTDYIIRLEKWLFGVYPTLWAQQFLRPWLDELMNIFYDTYFLFMPIVGFTLFFKKRYKAAMAAFSIGTAVHFSNFLLFYFLPTLGPQEVFSELQPLNFTGYIFADLTRILQAHGSVKGGAFPSSHVSAAFAWALIAFRYERKLGYFLIPMALGVGIATVYLGYHYAVDPICGILWCLIVFPIALMVLKKRGEAPIED